MLGELAKLVSASFPCSSVRLADIHPHYRTYPKNYCC